MWCFLHSWGITSFNSYRLDPLCYSLVNEMPPWCFTPSIHIPLLLALFRNNQNQSACSIPYLQRRRWSCWRCSSSRTATTSATRWALLRRAPHTSQSVCGSTITPPRLTLPYFTLFLRYSHALQEVFLLSTSVFFFFCNLLRMDLRYSKLKHKSNFAPFNEYIILTVAQ